MLHHHVKINETCSALFLCYTQSQFARESEASGVISRFLTTQEENNGSLLVRWDLKNTTTTAFYESLKFVDRVMLRNLERGQDLHAMLCFSLLRWFTKFAMAFCQPFDFRMWGDGNWRFLYSPSRSCISITVFQGEVGGLRYAAE